MIFFILSLPISSAGFGGTGPEGATKDFRTGVSFTIFLEIVFIDQAGAYSAFIIGY